jgi:hypothetical protein
MVFFVPFALIRMILSSNFDSKLHILTEILCTFPQSLQINEEIKPLVGQDQSYNDRRSVGQSLLLLGTHLRRISRHLSL